MHWVRGAVGRGTTQTPTLHCPKVPETGQLPRSLEKSDPGLGDAGQEPSQAHGPPCCCQHPFPCASPLHYHASPIQVRATVLTTVPISQRAPRVQEDSAAALPRSCCSPWDSGIAPHRCAPCPPLAPIP